MNFFPFRRQPKEEVNLILEIGSSSIAATISKISKIDRPEVVYTYREPIPIEPNRDPKRFAILTLETLNRVLKRISREGLEHLHFTRFGAGKIRQAHCILSSPWFASETKRLVMRQDKPFEVTPNLVAKLIEGEESRFLTVEEASDFGEHGGRQMVKLEKHVIQLKLNGYETAKPYGKEADELALTLFLSVAPADLLQKIQEMVAREFLGVLPKFHTFTLSSFSALRNIFHSETDFLLVEIGGEVTEIWLVRDGILHEAVSYPLGGNSLVRAVAKAAGAPNSVAISSIKMHQERLVNSPTEEVKTPLALKEANEETKLAWLRQFDSALKRLGANEVLPEKLFLITHEEFMETLVLWVKSAKFTQFAALEQTFSVKVVSVADLRQFCRLGKKAQIDPFSILHTIFLNSL
ncbi:MAG: hypothetical protein WCT25_01030 [Candidatus Paceibacterota bacterium]